MEQDNTNFEKMSANRKEATQIEENLITCRYNPSKNKAEINTHKPNMEANKNIKASMAIAAINKSSSHHFMPVPKMTISSTKP
mmetsp:Transcript_22420/g.45389  ORF Transcript_22420/g.45389 Transcript_22420/m.45389 type:complete len:83 (-) Transcript_22420:143-391(-)